MKTTSGNTSLLSRNVHARCTAGLQMYSASAGSRRARPQAVTREEYNFGDTAFQPSNFPDQ
jgi:hypothetical protein